jgi:hypothetical protein
VVDRELLSCYVYRYREGFAFLYICMELPWDSVDQRPSQMISPSSGDLLEFILSLDAKSWQTVSAILSDLIDLLDMVCDFCSGLSVILAGIIFLQSLLISSA